MASHVLYNPTTVFSPYTRGIHTLFFNIEIVGFFFIIWFGVPYSWKKWKWLCKKFHIFAGKRQEMKKMKSSAGNVRNTNNDLMHEILVKIFLCLNVVDVAVASLVCKSWNKASREPSLWNKIDLSTLGSYCFRKPLNKIEAYRHSSLKMTQFLKHVLDLSNGSTTCLIFNFYVYLTNEQFILVAQG